MMLSFGADVTPLLGAHALTPGPLLLPTLGVLESVMIFLVVLLLFGPGKLPDVAKSMGDAIKQFRKAARDVAEDVKGNAAQNKSPEPRDTVAAAEAPEASPQPTPTPPAQAH